jgi:hypothetical protein
MEYFMLLAWLGVVVGSLFATEFVLKKLNLLD